MKATNASTIKTCMKKTTLLLAVSLFAAPLAGLAADKKDEKARPYPLKTCLVSGEEINDKGDMKPYSFVHEGQEVKLCCKSCKPKFDKDADALLKKIQETPRKS